MADDEAIAAAIAKVKSKKSVKKSASKNGKSSEGLASNGKGGRSSTSLKVNGGGTLKRNSQGANGKLISQNGPIVHRPGAVKQRVIPTGQKLKYVFDLAKAHRAPLSFETIKKEKDVDVEGPVLDAIRKHALLALDEVACTVQYKPKYSVSTKEGIYGLIKQHPFGLLSEELADSYPEASRHLEEIIEDGLAFQCGSTERPCSIVYPNFYMPPGGLPDDSVRDALFDIQLPQTEEAINAALEKANIKKAKRSTPRLKMAIIQDDRKPVKEKKQRKLRKVTNVHMEHLFNDGGPSAIDR